MATSEWVHSAARAGDKSTMLGTERISDSDGLLNGAFAGMRPAVLHRAAHAAARCAVRGHPCQLSKARGVKVCTHPDHARDAAIALDWLQILGLAPPPPRTARQGATTSVSHKAYVDCPVCGKAVDMLINGTVGTHKRDGRTCPGTRRKPRREEP